MKNLMTEGGDGCADARIMGVSPDEDDEMI